MSGFMIMHARDWSQKPERQPVTEFRFVEYDDIDDEGFVGHVAMSVQVGEGRFVEKTFRLNPGAFRFFVEEIAIRYGSGGPK